jgi:hypothetical protein
MIYKKFKKPSWAVTIFMFIYCSTTTRGLRLLFQYLLLLVHHNGIIMLTSRQMNPSSFILLGVNL